MRACREAPLGRTQDPQALLVGLLDGDARGPAKSTIHANLDPHGSDWHLHPRRRWILQRHHQDALAQHQGALPSGRTVREREGSEPARNGRQRRDRCRVAADLTTARERRHGLALSCFPKGTIAAPQNLSCAPLLFRLRVHAMSASTPNPTLTLKDIASEAGVSLATVDRVLHKRPGVRPGTVKRVKDTIERHEFRPFAAAADLARGRTNRFAVVMTAGSNLFMQQILSHLREMNGWLSARRIVVEVVT